MAEMGDADVHGLADKVCVVTGAGGGIGRATALALARAGGRLVLLDVAQQNAETTASEVKGLGREAIAFACDVSEPGRVHAVADEAARALGPCDVLVNNAGVLRPASLETISLAEWNGLLSVNLTGYLVCAQIFGRQMRDREGGSIVHVASIAASHATAFSGAYSVAKAGIVMLSRQLAVEWGGAGIRSNAVSPGLILTPMSQAFYDQPGAVERRSAVIPAGRIGRPEDIAEAVLFLAGARASYITGEEITVDGGFTRVLMSLIPRAGYEPPPAPAGKS